MAIVVEGKHHTRNARTATNSWRGPEPGIGIGRPGSAQGSRSDHDAAPRPSIRRRLSGLFKSVLFSEHGDEDKAAGKRVSAEAFSQLEQQAANGLMPPTAAPPVTRKASRSTRKNKQRGSDERGHAVGRSPSTGRWTSLVSMDSELESNRQANATKIHATASSQVNGPANGHPNGHTNGHASGLKSGQADGHVKGQGNEQVYRHPNDDINGNAVDVEVHNPWSPSVPPVPGRRSNSKLLHSQPPPLLTNGTKPYQDVPRLWKRRDRDPSLSGVPVRNDYLSRRSVNQNSSNNVHGGTGDVRQDPHSFGSQRKANKSNWQDTTRAFGNSLTRGSSGGPPVPPPSLRAATNRPRVDWQDVQASPSISSLQHPPVKSPLRPLGPLALSRLQHYLERPLPKRVEALRRTSKDPPPRERRERREGEHYGSLGKVSQHRPHPERRATWSPRGLRDTNEDQQEADWTTPYAVKDTHQAMSKNTTHSGGDGFHTHCPGCQGVYMHCTACYGCTHHYTCHSLHESKNTSGSKHYKPMPNGWREIEDTCWGAVQCVCVCGSGVPMEEAAQTVENTCKLAGGPPPSGSGNSKKGAVSGGTKKDATLAGDENGTKNGPATEALPAAGVSADNNRSGRNTNKKPQGPSVPEPTDGSRPDSTGHPSSVPPTPVNTTKQADPNPKTKGKTASVRAEASDPIPAATKPLPADPTKDVTAKPEATAKPFPVVYPSDDTPKPCPVHHTQDDTATPCLVHHSQNITTEQTPVEEADWPGTVSQWAWHTRTHIYGLQPGRPLPRMDDDDEEDRPNPTSPSGWIDYGPRPYGPVPCLPIPHGVLPFPPFPSVMPFPPHPHALVPCASPPDLDEDDDHSSSFTQVGTFRYVYGLTPGRPLPPMDEDD